MRGRGLKPPKVCSPQRSILVAPRAGAWIETYPHFTLSKLPSRPPCGGVD